MNGKKKYKWQCSLHVCMQLLDAQQNILHKYQTCGRVCCQRNWKNNNEAESSEWTFAYTILTWKLSFILMTNDIVQRRNNPESTEHSFLRRTTLSNNRKSSN